MHLNIAIIFKLSYLSNSFQYEFHNSKILIYGNQQTIR